MSNTDKVRERIASTRFDADEWEWFKEHQHELNTKAQYRWDKSFEYANHILSDPDILVKAESQDLPEPFYKEIVPINSCYDRDNKTIKKAQQDMLKASWVKVEPKGVKQNDTL